MRTTPTHRQLEIAAYLESEKRQRGVMPTQREIAFRFGFSSTNAVRSHLRLMQQKGMLARLPGKARGLSIKSSDSNGIPLVGRIAAGDPLVAIEEAEEFLPVSPRAFRGSDLFALRIKGDSMNDVGIFSGDVAVLNRQPTVRDGEIAAVLLGDDATLKFFSRRRGAVVLRGANSAFADIVVEKEELSTLRVLGKYVGLLRSVEGA